MNKKFLILSVLAMFVTRDAQAAQEAPTPRQAPRIPVQRQVISEQRKPEAPPRQISGSASIVDNERLRLGRYDLRLFGVVPPQVSASYGVQARAALDALTAGQTITCSILDRAKDGRLLAQCHNGKNTDIALDLLRRGLAVAARGSLGESSLAASYIGAEQAAQTQKLGLWSLVVPDAASVSSKPNPENTQAELWVAPPVPEPKPEVRAEAVSPPTTAPVSSQAPAAPLQKIVAPMTPQPAQTEAVPSVIQEGRVPDMADPSAGFLPWVERLQFLLATLVASFTAFGVMGLHLRQKRRDRRHETSELAAALRGELMAARAIVVGRLRACSLQSDGADVAWPRIRATLFQASVGRLGLFGADLARQISSIYGQAHDYAAFYNSVDAERAASTPKQQALRILAQHIEAVLPRLEYLENKQNRRFLALPDLRKLADGLRVVKLRLPSIPSVPSVEKSAVPSAATARYANPSSAPGNERSAATLSSNVAVPDRVVPEGGIPAERKMIEKPASEEVSAKKDVSENMGTIIPTAIPDAPLAVEVEGGVTPPTSPKMAVPKMTAPKGEEAAMTEFKTAEPKAAEPGIDLPPKSFAAKAAVIAPLWVAVREFAQERFSPAPAQDVAEDPVTDYARMIEEEMATLGVYDNDYDDSDDAEDTLLKRMRG